MEFFLKLWLWIAMLMNRFISILMMLTIYYLEPSIPDNNLVVDWLQLPDHILFAIAIKINRINDFIRFGAVCQSWCSVYTENRLHLSHKPSLLMLAIATDELNNDYNNQTRSFYSLTEARVLDLRVALPHDVVCVGSSHGWLVTVKKDWEMTLLNPFLLVNNQIQLPPATTFEAAPPDCWSAASYPEYYRYVKKVVLSSNPSSNPKYVALAIVGEFCQLAFFKPGDKAWTSLDVNYKLVEDIIYYQKQFYFLDFNGRVYSCDFNHPLPRVQELAPQLPSGAV
ncbi:hypothetical protein FRX31_024430 [Thalictrum thalictroides]|uniref:KIB1-4 beta-propeller domain-containing protein n=1 Tax=Thalictrum thalictroides TaxID=46969 RepID=A0A7J6VP70_THATH|nr:hypothetical protein FRX31_024430 [Thalictrum thalictroides]